MQANQLPNVGALWCFFNLSIFYSSTIKNYRFFCDPASRMETLTHVFCDSRKHFLPNIQIPHLFIFSGFSVKIVTVMSEVCLSHIPELN